MSKEKDFNETFKNIDKKFTKIKDLKVDDVIDKIIEEGVFDTPDRKFSFRHVQRSIVKHICQSYIDKVEQVIIDAPTGSGKTIIALFVSEVLKRYNAKGYLLTSDIMLQEQYNDDIKKFQLGYGSIKGMDNYICNVNKERHKLGMCTVQKMKSERRKALPCYNNCQYFSARDEAIMSDVTLLNYSYFLLQRNKVAKLMGENTPFTERDFAIFDESHNIDNIVQNHFCISLNTEMFYNTTKHIVDFITVNADNLKLFSINKIFRSSADGDEIDMYIDEESKQFDNIAEFIRYCRETFDEINVSLAKIRSVKSNVSRKKLIDKVLELSNDLYYVITVFESYSEYKYRKPTDEEIKSILGGQHTLDEIVNDELDEVSRLNSGVGFSGEKPLLPSSWLDFFDNFTKIFSKRDEINTYMDIINDMGIEFMVLDFTDEELKFRNASESMLINEHLAKKTNFKVYMSATIGDPVDFTNLFGIEGKTSYMKIPSTFNFPKSPIFLFGERSLSYKHKQESIPYILEYIDFILGNKLHKNQRGVIHTASYEYSKLIQKYSKHTDRLIFYSGTEEKLRALEELSQPSNSHKVIVGPSLVEGLDLADDMGRFSIMVKVPYPHMNDNLVKAKNEIDNTWYKWKTMNSVVQMLGRTIRHKDDYAITYCLDHSFKNQLYSSSMPDYIQDRVVYLDPSKFKLKV